MRVFTPEGSHDIPATWTLDLAPHQREFIDKTVFGERTISYFIPYKHPRFLADIPFIHDWAVQVVAALHATMIRKPQRNRMPYRGRHRRRGRA